MQFVAVICLEVIIYFNVNYSSRNWYFIIFYDTKLFRSTIQPGVKLRNENKQFWTISSIKAYLVADRWLMGKSLPNRIGRYFIFSIVITILLALTDTFVLKSTNIPCLIFEHKWTFKILNCYRDEVSIVGGQCDQMASLFVWYLSIYSR